MTSVFDLSLVTGPLFGHFTTPGDNTPFVRHKSLMPAAALLRSLAYRGRIITCMG